MRLLIIHIIILLLDTQISVGKEKIVKVGAFNYYPAIFLDSDGKVKGFYVDALNEIGKKENINFVYVYGTWYNGLKKIKHGKIDLLTGVPYSKKQAEYLDFTSTPLLTVWGEVYVQPHSTINGILNIEGKKIAVMQGDLNADHLKELTGKLSINCFFIEVLDYDEVFLKISSGEVDAGVVNNTYGASKYDEYNLRSSGIVFNPFDIFFAVKKGSDPELTALLDKYLNQWLYDKNSIYNSARQKWSHGKIGEIKFFPEWLLKTIYISLGLIIILIAFIALLRYKVKKAADKIRKNEAIFETFMENTPAFVYIKDENLNYIFTNKMLKGVFSSKSDSKNSYPEISIEPKISKTLNDADKKIIEGNIKHFDMLYECNVNKKSVWLHDFKFTIDIPGEKSNVAGIAFDVSQLKETEFALTKAKEQAEESDLLKTTFLQNISHEIRTPMNAIYGFADRLIKSNLTKEKQFDYLQIIQNSSQQLLGIISDILAISSIETNQVKPLINRVSLNNILKDMFIIFSSQAYKKDIALYINKPLEDADSYIFTDRTKLSQILNNLLTNALKFTNEGQITFGYTVKDNYIELFVKDTGIGIDPIHHNKIFKRFIQADNNIHSTYGGSGLGLSIAKAYTELLGGTIRVVSEKNKGSAFYFTIPYRLVNDNWDSINPQNVYQYITNVIVAEDEEYNFMYLEDMFTNNNIRIIHAANGKEAVDICKAYPYIDLVLMDIRMPVLDGYEAAKQIKEFRPDVPIIAQTAYALDKDVEKYSQVFDEYISKPIQEEVLLKKISRCIRKYRKTG